MDGDCEDQRQRRVDLFAAGLYDRASEWPSVVVGGLDQALERSSQRLPAARARQLHGARRMHRRAPGSDPGGQLPVEERSAQSGPQRRQVGMPTSSDGQRRRRTERMRAAHAPSRLCTIRSISLMPMNGAMIPPSP